MISGNESARADKQDEVIAFLRRPASYGLDESAAVETAETHISIVFLAGDFAYKLKRAVKFPYLDFSTAEARHAACEAELTLNRRTAPQLYLEMRAISRRPDGSIGWGREGTPLDWVVVMRRFDQAKLFDRLARAGGLSAPLMYDLAAHIAEFHRQAEPRPDDGGAAAIREIAATNLRILRDRHAAGFDNAQIAALEARIGEQLVRVGPLLDARRARGKVRRCHGDLHLRNICLYDGKPLIFDCIEFSESIASVDVLYDLAFLPMDLSHYGEGRFANLVLNRYLDLSGEDDGLAAMPVFMALRAVIRAHVTASAAVRLAPELGIVPGARVLRSDVLRKRRFGLMPEERLPPEAYRPEVTAEVYRELGERATAALKAGYAAVIDAVTLRAEERRAFAEAAAEAGVPFTGLWLDAPAATMRERIGARRADASDATPAVLDLQLQADPGPLDWIRIDASGTLEQTFATARRVLGLD
jgi:aminoglycoside phosphotransferase family enzyme/predicted kinase